MPPGYDTAVHLDDACHREKLIPFPVFARLIPSRRQIRLRLSETLISADQPPPAFCSTSCETTLNLISPPCGNPSCERSRRQSPDKSVHKLHRPSAFTIPNTSTAMARLHLLSIFAVLLPLAVAQFCNNRPFYRSTFGNASITVITDGTIPVSTSSFPGIPSLAVRRSYDAAFRPSEPIILQQNVLLVELENRRILVDTGSFNTPELGPVTANAGRFPRILKRAGFDPDSIDAVVLTHAHVDHVGGLADRDGERYFKNAVVYVGRTEHDFWTSDPPPNVPTGLDQERLELFASVYLRVIDPYVQSGAVRFLDDGDTPLPGVRVIDTPGHSPGHLAVELSSDGETLLVIGDAWLSRADQVQHPEWTFMTETDAEAGFRSRVRLLEGAARRRQRVLAYHEQFPGLGFVEKVGSAFDWVPEAGITFGDDVCE